MTLCYEILTIGTCDSFFSSSCFSGQNEMFSTTKQNFMLNCKKTMVKKKEWL